MPHVLALNDVVEVQCLIRSNTHWFQNVLHYNVGLVGGASLTDQAAAAALGAIAGPAYKTYMASGADYEITQVQVIKPVVQPFWVSPVGAGPGAVADDELTGQSALIITKRTATAGRSFRGRAYLPGWPESANSVDGNPEAATLVAADVWASIMLAPITLIVGGNSVRLDPGVYSRKNGAIVPMTDYIVRPFWGTIKRRAETKSNY